MTWRCGTRALLEFSIRAKNIYIDKVSGKDFERPQYKALMKRLREKDVIVVKSMRKVYIGIVLLVIHQDLLHVVKGILV